MTFTISYLDHVRNVPSVPASGIGVAARGGALPSGTPLIREKICEVA